MVRIFERQEQLNTFLAEFAGNLVKENIVVGKIQQGHASNLGAGFMRFTKEFPRLSVLLWEH